MDKNFESLYENRMKSALLIEKELLKELKYSSIQKNEVFKIAEYLQSNLPETNISMLIKKMIGNSINEKSTQLLKKQKEISNMIINQAFNSITKQQIDTQIQSSEVRINFSTFESLMNDESNQFFKNHTQLLTILRQSFTSMDNKKSILGINNSIFESINQNLFKERKFLNKDFIENLNNFSKELYLDDKLDFDIKYEDIEKINKKIEQKKVFSEKEVKKFFLFLERIFLLYSIYLIFNPDNSEHIKTRQMTDIGNQQIKDKISQSEIKNQQTIKELDNKFSKSLNQEIYYEVTKNTNIREQPNTKSKKIAMVYPKQKLLVIENKPYWLLVEYFDEKRNETIIGWVSKKYTKRLD
jgi:hypothetical protein